MPFSLSDRWVWDAWYVEDQGKTHMFFLNAPKALQNPDHRHFYASIGHAVSDDLRNWRYLGTALSASERPAWDDLATWTGSVIQRHDGRWMMFYTGISRAERGHVQRIGAALSDDLLHWERMGMEPIVVADPASYATIDRFDCADEACRDPYVFPDPDGDGWHMYFTASGHRSDPLENGVIGHAWSPDLESWEVRPPIWQGDRFGELEVPELLSLKGRWYLLFSTSAGKMSEAYKASRELPPETGTFYMVSDDGPLGPWSQQDHRCLLGDPKGHHYVARRVADRHAKPALIAFVNLDEEGQFVGSLTDPIPFDALPDGRLEICRPDLTLATVKPGE